MFTFILYVYIYGVARSTNCYILRNFWHEIVNTQQCITTNFGAPSLGNMRNSDSEGLGFANARECRLQYAESSLTALTCAAHRFYSADGSPCVDRPPQDMIQRSVMAAYCKVLHGAPALGKDPSLLSGLIATWPQLWLDLCAEPAVAQLVKEERFTVLGYAEQLLSSCAEVAMRPRPGRPAKVLRVTASLQVGLRVLPIGRFHVRRRLVLDVLPKCRE